MVKDPTMLRQYQFQALKPPYNPLYFGTCPVQEGFSDNIKNWYSWNGGIRNIMLFDKFLNDAEIETLYKSGIRERYNWNFNGENLELKEVSTDKILSISKFNNLSNMTVTYCKSSLSLSEFDDNIKDKFFNVK
jgi:hypothetical protein